MELVISQLTTIVRKLEEHEFQKIAEVLEEDRSDQIDGVIANMVCLAETLVRFLQNENPFTKNSERKERKKLVTKLCMIASSIRAFMKSTCIGCRDYGLNAPRQLLPRQVL